ncbi:MAG: DUF3310 domain-containing protein [Fusobacteriaceae bacterium]
MKLRCTSVVGTTGLTLDKVYEMKVREDGMYETKNDFGNVAWYFSDNFDKVKISLDSHYVGGGIEPIEFINSNDLGFCKGNIIKYGFRVGRKEGQESNDIIKIIDYALLYAVKEGISVDVDRLNEVIKKRLVQG